MPFLLRLCCILVTRHVDIGKLSSLCSNYGSVICHETKNELEVTTHKIRKYFSPLAWQHPSGPRFFIVEVSRSYSHPPHSVGLLWMSDRSVADTSIWHDASLKRGRYPCTRGGIRTRNLSKWSTADSRPGLCCRWDRLLRTVCGVFCYWEPAACIYLTNER